MSKRFKSSPFVVPIELKKKKKKNQYFLFLTTTFENYEAAIHPRTLGRENRHVYLGG